MWDSMRVICSYCRRTIRADPQARITDVTHGMCEPCGRHFERLWAGMPLDEYLDDLGQPVLLTDGDGRVIAMNAKLAELIGADRKATIGLASGEAFACVRSRLPEGCGRTVHCRECAVRRSVEKVARTGRALDNVAAYLDVAAGRIDLRISARPAKAGIVQVKIIEMGKPRPRSEPMA
jgi:PAS domain-containing protein